MNKTLRSIVLSVLTLTICAFGQDDAKRLASILKTNPEREARDAAALAADVAWIKRVFLEPFRARLTGAAWDARATAFVERAVVLWNDPYRLGGLDGYSGLATLGDDAEALAKTDCADPLVMYLATMALFGRDSDDPLVSATLERAKKARTDAAVSNALKRFIQRLSIVIKARKEKKFSAEDGAKDAAFGKAAWQDGKSYLPSEVSVFLKHEVGLFQGILNMTPDEYGKAFKDLGLPEWAQLTIDGTVEINRGWKARGGGYADTVTDKGWEGLEKHFAQGSEMLLKAWTLNKNEPWAATHMISVAMAGGGKGSSPFDWFERSVNARFNQHSAYKQIILAVQPRWGGSYEAGMALGRAFLATKRFDTVVPLMYRDAEIFLPDNGEPAERYADPRMAKDFAALYEGLRDEPTRKDEKALWSQWLATFCWLGHDFDKAGQAYLAAGSTLNPAITKMLKLRKLEPADVESELALASVKQLARYKKAIATMEAGKQTETLAELSAIEKAAGPKAAPALAGVRRAAEFERDIATGKPVPVPFDDALAGWTRRLGKWTAENGALICKGTGRSASVLAPGRAGTRFVVRGKFDIQCPDGCCRQFMLFPGMKAPLGVAVGAYQKEKGDQVVAIHADGEEIPIPGTKVSVLEKNTFIFQVNGDKISMDLNGTSVIKDHDTSEIEKVAAGGRWGFYMPKACAKNTWKIYDVEVQKLP